MYWQELNNTCFRSDLYKSLHLRLHINRRNLKRQVYIQNSLFYRVDYILIDKEDAHMCRRSLTSYSGQFIFSIAEEFGSIIQVYIRDKSWNRIKVGVTFIRCRREQRKVLRSLGRICKLKNLPLTWKN